MARHRSEKGKEIPSALIRLIHAARLAAKDAEGVDIRGAAEAIREFGTLAHRALPVHGGFVANNDDISTVHVIAKFRKERDIPMQPDA